jgi:hypothetical protein
MPEFFILCSKKLNWKNAAWLLVPIVLSPLHFAHAYLDPGTGSYIIQVMIGIIFGASYMVKVFWRRIVDFFTGFRTEKSKVKDKKNE